MTKTCSICGTTTDDSSIFCDSCGSPIEEVKVEKQRPLDISLGFASTSSKNLKKEDVFHVLDTKAFFGETKNHRVLCVMIKGLAEFIDSKTLTLDLMADFLRNKGKVDYSLHFSEIHNKLKTDYANYLSSDTSKQPVNGLLLGVIDGSNVNVLCVGSPAVLVLKNGSQEMTQYSEDEPIYEFKLEKNEQVLFSSDDLFNLINESEVFDVVSKSDSPQKASECLRSKISTNNPEAETFLLIAQMTEKC